jgi:hypothetical protein
MSDKIKIDESQEEFKEIKRGTVVRETKGRKSGVVLWGKDPHNIQVQWAGGEIMFFCLVKGCHAYSGDKIDIRHLDFGDAKDLL